MANIKGLKKIAIINDMSGFGRCSLTVAIPIISAMGIQTCPLPTAILSNHTGYKSFWIKDFTEYMESYYKEWVKLNLSFNCIYSGFLGSEKQVDIVKAFFEKFKTEDTLIVVDPVMGDNGKLYSTFNLDFAKKLKELVSYADIVTPNLTEACLLTDTAYKEHGYEPEEIIEMAENIQKIGAKNVIITGIKVGLNEVRNFVLTSNEANFILSKRIDCDFPGTGDLFASVMCGHLLNGKNLQLSVKNAGDFVRKVAEYTLNLGTNPNEGVCFEPLIKELIKKL